MADDSYAYLQPDFDPNSLTVPRLRSILVAHSVAYPSSAKKNDLINLFNNNVAPQAKRLRNAQTNTKRSTRGIVDVPSSQSSVADPEEEEAEDVMPLETPARRTSRRTTRAATEDAVAATPRTTRASRQSTAPPSTVKRTSRRQTVQDVEPEEEIPATLAPPRTTRKSVSPALSPVLPAQDEDEEPKYYQGPESPFSRDNPFQSGSSPPATERKSAERRRTTLGRAAEEEKSRIREPRRRTEGYRSTRQDDDGVLVPVSRSKPTAAVKHEKEHEDFAAGEEFAPEEQMELEQAQQSGTVATRPRRRKQGSSGVAKAAPWSVLVALLGGIATVWRQEKLNVGYCGVGQPSTALAGVQIPDWASTLQPQCEPCPQHAYCYPNLETVCEPDFVLHPHPLSLNGLLPLPPTCEPDSEKVRKIKQVADFAVENGLRERNAKYECGEVKKPEITEDELKATVSAKRSKRMSDEEFNELWESALGEVIGREEVTSKIDGTSRLLRSSSLARVPLSCAIRRSLVATTRQHLPKLVALILLSLSAVYGKHALTTRRSTTQRAKQLAAVALDKLANQAALHADDNVAYPEPYLSMVALRDDVLRDEFSSRERGRVWDVVRGLVEGNANVRTMVREGRTGEVSRVWEWIGAVQRIEDSEGSVRRRSGRFSLGGPGRVAGTPEGKLLQSGEEGASEMLEVSRWSEGGGQYF